MTFPFPPGSACLQNVTFLCICLLDLSPESRNFRANIRNYNAAFAMASWNANIQIHRGRGPQVVTIHGQAYHATGPLLPQTGHTPQYAQLYIMDSRQALQERL